MMRMPLFPACLGVGPNGVNKTKKKSNVPPLVVDCLYYSCKRETNENSKENCLWPYDTQLTPGCSCCLWDNKCVLYKDATTPIASTKKMVSLSQISKEELIEREYSIDESGPFVRFPLWLLARAYSSRKVQLQPSSTMDAAAHTIYIIYTTIADAERKMRNCWKRICIYCGAPQSYRATDLTPPRPSSPPSHFLCPFEKCPEKKTPARKWIGAIHLLYTALMRRERTMAIDQRRHVTWHSQIRKQKRRRHESIAAIHFFLV